MEHIESTVVGLLKERGLTLAAAESCTGGLLSKRLTDIPGASSVYPGGVVTYSEQSKIGLLGVPHELIKEKNAASSEVALLMAENVRIKLNADIGVSITGIAGPDSDSSGHRPGTVFVALTTKEASYCEALQLPGDREQIRRSSASHALEMIKRILTV